jgi:hypothetical protein
VSWSSVKVRREMWGGEDEQVRAMQRDSSTYCDEPKDVDEYEAWIRSFRIDDRKDEIEELLSSNAFMQELQNRIVPLVVEYDVFWTRYFFHLHKLQQVENARANLVKRESLLCCTLFFNVHIFVDMESLNLQVRQNKYAVALTPHTKFAWFMWISRVCSTRDWRTWGIYS